MAVSSADRKREQRARVARGAVSADVIQRELLRMLRVKVALCCRDTDRRHETILELVYEVAEQFDSEEHFRVEAYLGVCNEDPDYA